LWNSGAMFAIALFLVLPALWLLLTNWQLVLIGLGVWALMRPLVAAVDARGGVVSREPPAPAYLPRWTARRRLDARRELAQWQEWFDAAR
jgi:hypothetical protein